MNTQQHEVEVALLMAKLELVILVRELQRQLWEEKPQEIFLKI